MRMLSTVLFAATILACGAGATVASEAKLSPKQFRQITTTPRAVGEGAKLSPKQFRQITITPRAVGE